MIGANTVAIDGSRFTVPSNAAYNPYGFGQTVQPQPIQNVNFPPMLPNGGGATGSGGALAEAVGGYGTAGQNAAATAIASTNPWSLKASPTIWFVILLILSLVLIGKIFWRKQTSVLGESAHAGPASEGAAIG